MHLDVIIPTFNRQELLQRTLQSLLDAPIPAGLEVCVAVVDNNSTDKTREVVESWTTAFEGRLRYVFETKQGRSRAINAGVAAMSGDLVGMIDDDEEVSPQWFIEIGKAFSNVDVDFIGGPCLPRWGIEPPAWLPKRYRGVIGWVENGDEIAPFDGASTGILMGGNAVIRRSVMERVGPYSTALGRTDRRLLSCEDEEMFQRLLAAGARGLYLPQLVIFHYIPPERLTRSYHRRWCFWRGVSQGVLDRTKGAPVTYLLGVPRYLFGNAARGAARFITAGDRGERFSSELALWDLAGFFYGKHFFKADEGGDETPGNVVASSGQIQSVSQGQ
jgi:glycosyltransferase involved in cell wall biosynthesis